jgi:vacuolar-type H+-ATPase subunit E/Vma4
MIFVTTEEAWQEAAKCTEKAEQALDEEIRRLFLRLRDKVDRYRKKSRA